MADPGPETGGTPEGVASGPKYSDIINRVNTTLSQHALEADPNRVTELQQQLVDLEQQRAGLVERARNGKYLDNLDDLIKIEVDDFRAKRITSSIIKELIEKEFTEEKERTLPEELRGLKKDYYDRIRAELVTAEKAPLDEKSQIEWLSQHMSALEASGRSYREMGYDPNFMRITGALPGMRVEAQKFFRSRLQVYEAWLLVPNAGGSIDAFTKLAETAGMMSIADTMLSHRDVAEAYVEFEIRSQEDEKSKNPARCSALQSEEIRLKIALKLAEERGDVENAGKYIWVVRQGETIWRMWMRAALADGLAFKPGVDDMTKKRLSSLRPTELREHWEEIQKIVDWPNSFEGRGEFAVRRLLYSALAIEKGKGGEARIRPYLYFGSKDFLSNFLDEKFLKEGGNFRDGIGFSLVNRHPNPDKPEEADPDFDRVYEKRGEDGKLERITITRNGVVALDKEYRLNLGKIIWTAKGEDAYVGTFAAYNLSLADGIRKAVMDPDKLARDPSLKVLMDLVGSFESFSTTQKDIEDEEAKQGHPLTSKERAVFLEQKRAGGKIYREDIFAQLATGLLEFQMKDKQKRFHQKNINFEDINVAVNLLRSRGMVTDQLAEKMKSELLKLKGMPSGKFFQLLFLAFYQTQPMGILMAMLGEMFKQITSQK